MPASNYGRIENGKKEPTKLQSEVMAKALNWPVNFFYNRDFVLIDIKRDWNTLH